MKCRHYENNLPEWTAGRIHGDIAQQMQAHEEACPICAKMTREERALRRSWQSMPTPSRTPDLWYRVEAKLSAPPARRRFDFGRIYAYSGALAAAAAMCVIWVGKPGSNIPVSPRAQLVSAAQEQRVVELVSDVQLLRDPDSDTVYTVAPHAGKDARAILLGGTGK
jgi:ferric-dicitrate binding protein FerR (iron transport regulator)